MVALYVTGSIHSRVATAAAGALSAAAVGCGPALERHLPAILPTLLQTAADERHSDIAKAANRALQGGYPCFCCLTLAAIPVAHHDSTNDMALDQ